MKATLFFVAFVVSATVAQGQGFSSGSTGDDGAYAANCGGGSTSRQIPPSGVVHFTTVTITNYNVSFIPNQRNTPVIILAQGES